MGLAEACGHEAEHLHNLPALIASFRREAFVYYCDVERASFLKGASWNVDEFRPLWDKLDELVQTGT